MAAGAAALEGNKKLFMRHAGRTAKVILPGANMWFTKAAYDIGVRATDRG